jgi:hypothetical protein
LSIERLLARSGRPFCARQPEQAPRTDQPVPIYVRRTRCRRRVRHGLYSAKQFLYSAAHARKEQT